MKTIEPNGQNEPLSKALKEWRTNIPVPPRFQEEVWRRIELAQAPTATSVGARVAHWIGTMLPRPALAASYVAVLVAIGVTVGWAQAHQNSARIKDELGQRYVRVLDPYQAPRE